MSRSRHSILLNAFRPAKEIDKPEFFAGRAAEVRKLVDSLHTIGSCPIIYGDRGLGKTSLAWQIALIAMGDEELLESFNLQSRALDEDSRYLVFFVTCTDETKNFDGVVQLLINSMEEADFGQNGGKNQARRLTERTVSYKVSLKAFEASNVKKYEQEIGRESYKALSLTEKLQQLIRILVENFNQPLLFIIDEVDRLQSTQGLASLIKATSSEDVKFMLVGIASNITHLLADHRSLERSLAPVKVPVMNEGELHEIIEKVEAYLQEEGIDITFDHFAGLAIVRVASGYPWFVHVIGQSALLMAEEKGRGQILDGDIHLVVSSLANNQFAQQFGNTYLKIVGESQQREMVLRVLASWRDVDVPTSEVYKVLRELHVTNPSVPTTQLKSKAFDQVIHSVPGNRGWVRFDNEMFKIYVRLRPSVFLNVDERVRTAVNEVWYGA